MDIHAWLHGTEDRRPPPDEQFLLQRTPSPGLSKLDRVLRSSPSFQKEQGRADGRRDTPRPAKRTSKALQGNCFPQETASPLPEDLADEWRISEEEDAASASSAKYRRRRRRKTRADRYELKTSRAKKRPRHAEKHVPVRKTRRTDSTAANGVVRAFELNARSKQRRVTLDPVERSGLFMHGRSAKCFADSKGLPDLTFAGLSFLQRKKQQDVDDSGQAAEHHDDRRNENARISGYFQTKHYRSTDENVCLDQDIRSPKLIRSQTSIMMSQLARNSDIFFGREDLDNHDGVHVAAQKSPGSRDLNHHDVARIVQQSPNLAVHLAVPTQSTTSSLPGRRAEAETAKFLHAKRKLAVSSGKSQQRQQHTSSRSQRQPLQALRPFQQRRNQLPGSDSPMQLSQVHPPGSLLRKTPMPATSFLSHRAQPVEHSPEESCLASRIVLSSAVSASERYFEQRPHTQDGVPHNVAAAPHIIDMKIHEATTLSGNGRRESARQTAQPRLPTRQLNAFVPELAHASLRTAIAEPQASASNTMLWHHASQEAAASKQCWLLRQQRYAFDDQPVTTIRHEDPPTANVDFTSEEQDGISGGVYQAGMDHVSTVGSSIDLQPALAPQGFWRPNKLY
ncbi:hypothetical protein AMS68_000848 [Peltaster fructicola]|uniref:Uncharacterized protein n=1 Tax=Peltaster fructicola TaxID=286661 RepID=A0A6H0XL21_9PEZI|nr:hypothetical protein AMS68_000848 [Peltaster fructicola]